MTIYLDAIWALNFFLDWMLLLLTQALAKEYTPKIRILLGAFVASLLVPLTLFFPDSFFTTVYGKIVYSCIIIFSSFHFYNIQRTLKLLFLFYFSSFSVGGGLIALHFLNQNPVGISASGILTFHQGFGEPISWMFIIVGFPIVWYFTKVRMDKHVVEKIRYDQLHNVTLTIKQQSFTTTGYIDSGNQLIDPISKRFVIICDQKFLRQWFTKEDWEKLQYAHDTLDLNNLPKSWERFIQIVPYHGVEGKNNFLFAIRPDQLMVHYGDQKIITKKVLVGIQFGTLTKDQTYHCLLHPQIVMLSAVHSA